MKKAIFSLYFILFLVSFSGCSFRHIYIIRNQTSSNIELRLRLKNKLQNNLDKQSVNLVDDVSSIKKLANLKEFDKNTPLIQTGDGVYTAVIPVGSSADISGVIKTIASHYRVSDSFNGNVIEIKTGNTIMSFGNNLKEMEQFFKIKTFFARGPIIHYLDLK